MVNIDVTMAHDHNHDHAPRDYNAAFAIGIGLNVFYIVLEVVFGLLGDSLALLADAGHNLTDVLGLLLAWGAHRLASAAATPRRTYGWRRASILAALANALLLIGAVVAISWEASQRFAHPQTAAGATIMWVAGAGVLVNAVTAWLFMAGRKDDINVRGAFVHMAADAGVSLAVVLAGAAIQFTGVLWIDPVMSLLVAAVILVTTWSLLRDSVNLAVDAVPEDIDPTAVESFLTQLPGVVEVHDLHIWPLSTTETALTAHLVRPGAGLDDDFLAHICDALHDRFHIGHTTIQIEHRKAADSCGHADHE